jgi:hypothetical protein
MRLVHLAKNLETPGSGVADKIVRTVEAWRLLGADATILDAASGEVVDGNHLHRPTSPPASRLGWLGRSEADASRVLAALDRLRPDVVHTREMIWTPAVESIFRRHRVVLEVSSDAAAELSMRSRAAATYWRLTSGRLRRRAAGIVSVTDELADRLSPSGVPRIVLGNAAEVPSAPTSRICTGDARPMLLMLIGSPAPWHGLDRVGRLATLRPDLRIVVCGHLGDAGRDLPPEVECREPVRGNALRELIAEASVGIGTLALSRSGLREACPLKSRTMLAAGRPLVSAYDDPSLDGREIFVLRIPDDDSAIDQEAPAIAAFAHAAAEDPAIGESAWAFARDHLAVDVVERRRLAFFEQIMGFG